MTEEKRNEVSRRGFLSGAGKTILAAKVAGLFPKDAAAAAQQLHVPDAPGRKLGWAVVGLGSLAINQILPAFATCEQSKVTALVSGHPDKAKKLAARYGVAEKNLYTYETFDQLRDNPDVDVIYIVLPNGMHAEYTIRSAKAGKHVLCEKPMANTPADCQRMNDACREASRLLMIAYRLHYEPYNQALTKV